jgi:16S rRNA (uracil1498-N3)-methyltransferase
LLERFTGYDAVLFPWELAPREPVIERLRDAMAGAQRILAVIGPEGGFSHDEAAAAAARGARWLWLGPRILRTETAGMALLAVVAALTY